MYVLTQRFVFIYLFMGTDGVGGGGGEGLAFIPVFEKNIFIFIEVMYFSAVSIV